jgi:uncharacterized membrane protein HdeD (DUF308 family)
MNSFLLGAMSMGFFVAGLFFWSYFRTTRDVLFLLFSVAFWVECLNRGALALADSPTEGRPIYYLGRLLSYVLIVAAIVNKNLSKRE